MRNSVKKMMDLPFFTRFFSCLSVFLRRFSPWGKAPWKRISRGKVLCKNLWKDDSGFMLIEAAIAMIIFGLIVGPGFMAWHTHNTLRKHRITLYHQRLVFQSLAQYLQLHGCLPFPTPLHEPLWGESVPPKDPSLPLKPGLIPYRTLGLPLRVAKDGFGHWMTYAVDVNFTHRWPQFQHSMCENFFTKEPSALEIIEFGKSVNEGMTDPKNTFKPLRIPGGKHINPDRFNGIAALVVSHGNKGWGAPLSPGKRIPFPSSVSKESRINGDDSLKFFVCDHSAEEKSISHGVVTWKTRSQITDDAHISCMDYLFQREVPRVSGSSAGETTVHHRESMGPGPSTPPNSYAFPSREGVYTYGTKNDGSRRDGDGGNHGVEQGPHFPKFHHRNK